MTCLLRSSITKYAAETCGAVQNILPCPSVPHSPSLVARKSSCSPSLPMVTAGIQGPSSHHYRSRPTWTRCGPSVHDFDGCVVVVMSLAHVFPSSNRVLLSPDCCTQEWLLILRQDCGLGNSECRPETVAHPTTYSWPLSVAATYSPSARTSSLSSSSSSPGAPSSVSLKTSCPNSADVHLRALLHVGNDLRSQRRTKGAHRVVGTVHGCDRLEIHGVSILVDCSPPALSHRQFSLC